jgi:hypothetical protein
MFLCSEDAQRACGRCQCSRRKVDKKSTDETTAEGNPRSLGLLLMQGFAITTGRPFDDRIGELALRRFAVPFVSLTGKTPQLLARFIFSLTCLLWVVGPAFGGGYTKDLLGNGVQMLVTLLLLWLGLRLSWQIEGLAAGCDANNVPVELLATGLRFGRNRWVWGAYLFVEFVVYAASGFGTTDLCNLIGLAFLVLGSYVVTCVVFAPPRRKRVRLPSRLTLIPSLARVRG